MGWRPIWQDFDNPDQIIQASSVQFSSVAQSCPTLRDPMDCSLPGSSVHGIFQARVLEWGAIAFSTGHFLVEAIFNLTLKVGVRFQQELQTVV